ncbi:MAG: hypothetical protein AAGA77_09730 [Bacteroidota bacterium]
MKKNNEDERNDFEVLLSESFRIELKDELSKGFKEYNKSSRPTPAISKYKRLSVIILANAAIVVAVLSFVFGFQNTSASDRALHFLDQTKLNYNEDVTRDVAFNTEDPESPSITEEIINTTPSHIGGELLKKLSNNEKLNIGYYYLSNGKSPQVIDSLFKAIQNENSGLKAEKLWLWSLSKIIHGETDKAVEYIRLLQEESSYKTKEINQLLELLNE